MKYIVEVHNRPGVNNRFVSKPEPDFDYWFTLEVKEKQPVYLAMREKALEIVNEKVNKNYNPSDLAIFDRTQQRIKIDRGLLSKLQNGEIVDHAFGTNWTGSIYKN